MCQRIGRPPTSSTIGFGLTPLSSLIRVPKPPASTTAFIIPFPVRSAVCGRSRPRRHFHVVVFLLRCAHFQYGAGVAARTLFANREDAPTRLVAHDVANDLRVDPPLLLGEAVNERRVAEHV